MKRLLLPALIFGIALWASNSNAKPAPAPADGPIEPDEDAEAQACASAVADKPDIELGVARGGRDMDQWLAAVAFARAYGRWPNLTDPLEGARLKIIHDCVRDRLGAEASGQADDAPPDISDVPVPGRWYRIRYGDALFKISSAAYGTQSGTPANYQAAKRINEASENRRFWRMVPSEKGLWPKGRITFFPIFGTYEQQRADPVKGGEVPKGGGYAVIWIPPE